jgi:hypothetical protein
MSVKYPKNLSQGLPKHTKIWIFGMKMYHLATQIPGQQGGERERMIGM